MYVLYKCPIQSQEEYKNNKKNKNPKQTNNNNFENSSCSHSICDTCVEFPLFRPCSLSFTYSEYEKNPVKTLWTILI